MDRKFQFLLVTHLLVLLLGYGVVRNAAEHFRGPAEGAREIAKTTDRGQVSSDEGDALLADFLNERTGKKSRYAELKETLPVARDLKGAVVSAVAGLGGADWRKGLTRKEQAARCAEVEVRVLHWMKQNPIEALGFVLNDPTCEAAGIPEMMNQHVLIEIATQNGVLNSVGWLARNEVAFGTLCAVALNEMRAGGGFALYEKLAAAIWRSPGRDEFLEFRARPMISENPADDGERFLRQVGAATRFEERDRLLAMVKRMNHPPDQIDLLSGFAGSSGQAAEWLHGILKSGELKEELSGGSRDELDLVILGVAGLDLNTRLEIMKEYPGNGGRAQQELLDELTGENVVSLLESGRDWRFEFRNGKATLDDVLAAVRQGMPHLPEAGEEAMRGALFRELAEENPKKALPLLDALPPEKRREVLLDAGWLGFANVSPDHFLRFMAEVPNAASPEEQARKLKGWHTRARADLWRYGDDYIEWVRRLPPGIHREAAVSGILLVTSEENPEQARELGERFYPRKP
ncbi:MAG: hypothetical protein ACRCXD_16225 [Luteolibacter sp.]